MRVGRHTRSGILLALALLTAAGSAGAGKGPTLSASGQTIGGPAEVRLEGGGALSQSVAWFQEPIDVCATLVSNVDTQYHLVLESGGPVYADAPAGQVVTTCRPDVRELKVECLHPKSCRVTWRIDQLEEALR